MKRLIILFILLYPCTLVHAQKPFVAFHLSNEFSQVYDIFQLEDSTYRVFTSSGAIGSPNPYLPNGQYFDVKPDAKLVPNIRNFPTATNGAYLPGDFYYNLIRYDSADTRYSKISFYNKEIQLQWSFTVPNNDEGITLWPVENNQYIGLKQNGRILRFSQFGFIDSTYSIYHNNMTGAHIVDASLNSFIYSFWSGDNQRYFDTLIFVKSDMKGNTLNIYKYYQKDGLIFYQDLRPLRNKLAYELCLLIRIDSLPGPTNFKFIMIKLDSNLSQNQVRELDTALVNKYKSDSYFFTQFAHFKKGFARVEKILSNEPSAGSNTSTAFALLLFNDNWEQIKRITITDSVIKSNSKVYKSFDIRSWYVDIVKTTKDSGLIVGGHYRIGFPYETLPFLIKTDTSGNVIWEDAMLGDIPSDIEATNSAINPIVIYPNPNNTNQLHINFPKQYSSNENVEVAFYNAMGQQVKFLKGNSQELKEVDIEQLIYGCYVVEVRGASNTIYRTKLLRGGGR
jgi:hypothetical protein